jgi:hypothetical protein
MENAKMLNASLEIQMMRAETIWWKEHQQLYSHLSHSQQHQARRGFMFAFADAAALKMKEATARGKASAEEQHGRESVALVLRDKSLDVKAEFDRMFPQTRKVKDRKNHGDMFARAAGNEAGRNADVGQAGLGNDRKALNS